MLWNDAFSIAGPACTVDQVETTTGIFIDHFVVVDFASFGNMVDAALGYVHVLVAGLNELPGVDYSGALVNLEAMRAGVKVFSAEAQQGLNGAANTIEDTLIPGVAHLRDKFDEVSGGPLAEAAFSDRIRATARAVTEVGGYRDVHFMEDYDLYARLIAGGWQVRNLPEALTDFQVTDAQFSRRTGREMLAAEVQMQRNLVAYGLVSRPRAAFNLAARTAYRALPTGVLRRVYAALFHRGE